MKAKVLRAFIDKGTDKAHKVGEVIDLNEERFALLSGKGFVTEDYSDQSEEIAALRKENAALKAAASKSEPKDLKAAKAEISKLQAENAELKAVIEAKAAEAPVE